MPWYRRRINRVLALGDLQDAISRAEASEPEAPPVFTWLEAGARISAVTDTGKAVEGVVDRIYQTPKDLAAGVFRFACEPAGDSSSEEGAAS